SHRVRMAFTELGPTFIKLGQILSTRPDLIGLELSDELKHLQSNVPSDPPDVVQKIVETELGKPLGELFETFDLKALASASIGQVHIARLKTGEEVVVKVQHLGIEDKIQQDLDILLDLAELLEKHVEESRNYRPIQTSDEFKRLLLKELDFLREKRNLEQFTVNFARSKNVHIPKVYNGYCTSRVLTMEKLNGIKISEREKLIAAGYNLSQLAVLGATTFLRMIFEHGFYHADPHPGNIIIMEGQKIGLIDCGMVGRLDDDLREDIEDILMSIVNQNSKKLLNIITRLGSTPRNLDRMLLNHDISEFVHYYSSLPLQDLKLNKAMQEMTSIIRRHGILLPSSISLLIKVLVMLEGTSHSLTTDFDLISVMKPYQKKMVLNRLSPARQKRMLQNFYQDIERLMHVVPMGLMAIIENLQRGDLTIKLDYYRLENSVNRVGFGMITSAIFLGSSLLMSFNVKPMIWEVSFPGLVGYIVSFIFGIKLLWSIYTSGNLYDRQKNP
ncbi:MAG: AarF/ABC1/UbiB kinase family protein, partial [Planctomycetota bacterium]